MRTFYEMPKELFDWSVRRRIHRSVFVRDGCWSWGGGHNKAGYPVFTIGPRGAARHYLAHRLVWAYLYDDPGQSILVMHKCDNPSCVNPAHLSTGTYADNNSDSSRKGRKPGNVTPCKPHNKELFRILIRKRRRDACGRLQSCKPE